jgi:hypothetical protein
MIRPPSWLVCRSATGVKPCNNVPARQALQRTDTTCSLAAAIGVGAGACTRSSTSIHVRNNRCDSCCSAHHCSKLLGRRQTCNVAVQARWCAYNRQATSSCLPQLLATQYSQLIAADSNVARDSTNAKMQRTRACAMSVACAYCVLNVEHDGACLPMQLKRRNPAQHTTATILPETYLDAATQTQHRCRSSGSRRGSLPTNC